jgi:hypothetical protein
MYLVNMMCDLHHSNTGLIRAILLLKGEGPISDRTTCSRSRNTPTPTTAYVLIGSTEPKSRSRFSLNSAAARWRSRRTRTNRAELSIAAETSSYLGKVGTNLRGWIACRVASRFLPHPQHAVRDSKRKIPDSGRACADSIAPSVLLTIRLRTMSAKCQVGNQTDRLALIPRVNRLPNSPVDSRREQRRW